MNLGLFLACVPLLVFMGGSYKPKEKGLAPFQGCGVVGYCTGEQLNRFAAETVEDVNESDAILSVDLLNNWHWCPSARTRMRALDEPVNEFLAKARRKGALVIHAVSDSKPHYLNEPGIIQAARTKATSRVPDGGGRDWGSIDKFELRTLEPPPPTSLSLDRACGDSGMSLFGARKPRGLPGLNETNVDAAYDMVAIDMDVIYSAIKSHKTRIRRILYVGVHLDLCILYSRWFSILRVAKFWNLGSDVEYGIIAPLVDMSNSRPTEHFSTQMVRDPDAVARMACWISCVAGPQVVGPDSRIRVFDYRKL